MSRRETVALEIEQLEALRAEVAERLARSEPPRWNADPEDVERSLARLVAASDRMKLKIIPRDLLSTA